VLVSHLHNAIFLEFGEEGPTVPLLAAARECLSGRPWLRLTNRPPIGAKWDRVLDHGSPVRDVGWSADADVLASIGSDGIIKLWDPEGGSVQAEIEPSSGFAWRPYGSEVASWYGDALRGHDGHGGCAWAWRLDNKAGEVTGAAWSPDGRSVGIGTSHGAVLLVNPRTKTQTVLSRPSGNAVGRIVFSGSGANLAAGGSRIRLWRLEGGRWILAGEGNGRHPTWSWDGSRLAVISSASHLHFLDAAGRDLTGSDSSRGNQSCIDWSPVGRIATARSVEGHGYTAWIDVSDPASGDNAVVPASAARQIRDVAWSPTGEALAYGGADPPEVGVWEKRTTRRLTGHTDAVVKVAWSPDGGALASASDDGTVRTWSLERSIDEDDAPPRGHSARLSAVMWSPDGSQLASGGRDNAVYVWDASTGRRVARFTGYQSSETFGYAEAIEALAWSPDGSLLAVGGRSEGDHRTLHVWDPIPEDDVYSLPRSSADLALRTDNVAVQALAWSDDGRRLFSRDGDGMIRTWKISRAGRSKVQARLIESTPSDVTLWPGQGQTVAESLGIEVSAEGNKITVVAADVEGRAAVAHCLSPVVALQLSAGGDMLRAADSGAASENRPIPYLFELRNLVG
jgi:WD40 repeat protein